MRTVRLGLLLLFLVGFARGETLDSKDSPLGGNATDVRSDAMLADKGFESKLRVELEKVEQDGDVGRSGAHKVVSYNITFENRADVPITGIEVNYRMFFEAGKCEIFGKTKLWPWFVPGDLKLDLAAGESRTISTQPLHLRNGPGPGRPGSDMAMEYKGRFHSLYLCVARKDQLGKMIERSFDDGEPPDKEDWEKWRKMDANYHL